MIIRTLLLSCILLLNACTNRLTSPLDIKHKQHIHNIDAYIEQPQSQITVEVEKSNASTHSGHWIGTVYDAIHNSIVESNAAKRTQLLQAFYIDTKVQNILHENLNNTINQQNWFKSTPVEFASIENESIQKILETSQKDAVIFHKATFSISPQLDTIKVMLNAQMYPTKKSAKKLIDRDDPHSKPLLAFTINSTAHCADKTTDADENIGSWEWNNGENFKSALRAIIVDIMKKYHAHINTPEKIA